MKAMTTLQAQDSEVELWWSEAEHATSRSRRLPTILNLCEWAGKKLLFSLKLEWQSGGESAMSDFPTWFVQHVALNCIKDIVPIWPTPIQNAETSSFKEYNRSTQPLQRYLFHNRFISFLTIRKPFQLYLNVIILILNHDFLNRV